MRSRVIARLLVCAAAGVVSLAATGRQNPPATIVVDPLARRHAISPLVYGVSGATAAQLADLHVPLHRLGGNPTSRCNWQENACNRGVDWYFESVGGTSAEPGANADAFIADANAAGAEPMVTVPMLDWVARLGPGRSRLASFSIAKYGAQTGRDAEWFPDAGNGIRAGGAAVTGNNPADANVRVTPAFQQAWVRHLVSRWGAADAGGVRDYLLDNEPSLWHDTHRDVHPDGATMAEVRTRMVTYAAAIKAVDPAARVIGPEEWGWPGYLYSGADQQWAAAHGWGGALPDRASHGGWDYLPWLLRELRQASVAAGRRLLDVVSVHYYPQGGETGTSTSASMQRLRNRSTRALWDPDYVDESWIGDRVQLIPRLRAWVDAWYAPGTPIAITEYNWGAEAHISGALAQADVLGIFGREGLDLGARWTTPDAATPTYKAIKLYRNYDGRGSAFGDVSIAASGPNPDEVAVFAATRTSDGALTVMVISKVLSGDTPVTIALANVLDAGTAERWQLTSANAITRLADLSWSGRAVSDVLPPQSVTLFVVRAAVSARPGLAAAAAAESGALRVRGAEPIDRLGQGALQVADEWFDLIDAPLRRQRFDGARQTPEGGGAQRGRGSFQRMGEALGVGGAR